MIKTYGADAVRVGLMLSSNAGNDYSLMKLYVNKEKILLIRYGMYTDYLMDEKLKKSLKSDEINIIAIDWFKNLSYKIIEKVEYHFAKYRISDALMTIYKFIWEEFCSWFLEVVKPNQNNLIDENENEIKEIFETNLKLLSPFMPFIAEELWHLISKGRPIKP